MFFSCSNSNCYLHFTKVLQFKYVGVFLNNSNFFILGIRLLVPYCTVGGRGEDSPPAPLLSKWFISDLGKMILYFRKDFQNLAADQKWNGTVPHHISGINTKEHSALHKRKTTRNSLRF